MIRLPLRSAIACVLMVCASVLAVAAKPTARIADSGPKVNLESMVPKQFGDWTLDTAVVPVLPSPEAQALLSKIYNQTLARTYVNRAGDRVMLSIAYGGDQSDSLQLHRPEVCYAAQGFQVADEVKGVLKTTFGNLPVKRLKATLGRRSEPITYWVTVGDEVIYAGFKQKLVQISYGLTGRIPDGMLVRVSSIDADSSRAFSIQSQFAEELVLSLNESSRERFIGKQL